MNQSKRFTTTFKALLATILILMLFQVAASTASAGSITFVACANKETGALRIAYKTCTKNENPVDWGVSRPQSATELVVCKSKTTGAISLRTACTSVESLVSNNNQLIGKTGATGLNGKFGLTGLQGLSGTAGATGENGHIGAIGATGAVGIGGHDGNPGADGAGGAAGTNGNDGNPGADGADGTGGAAGTNGNPGTNGIDGNPGTNGIDGNPGTNGEAGIGLTEASIGKDCVIRFKDTEIKGIFVWVETAAESNTYVMGCNTTPQK